MQWLAPCDLRFVSQSDLGGWGDNLWGQGYLAKAVAAGLTKESAITESVHRTFMQKMKVGLCLCLCLCLCHTHTHTHSLSLSLSLTHTQVGLFDPPEDSPWTEIGLDDLNTTYSQGAPYMHLIASPVISTYNLISPCAP